jgi:hypothetical protein
MAKKQAKPGPPPVEGNRTAASTIRSTPAWKAWVERLADFDRSTVSDLIDHALVAYAREKRFPDAPPKR